GAVEPAGAMEQELRRQRQALAAAVNRHDVTSVKQFIHVSYVGKHKGGHTVGYQEMLNTAERLLGPGSDFQEEVQIEDVTLHGDTARLTVLRTHTATGFLWFTHHGTNRAVETWRLRDGRWQIVEEQELEAAGRWGLAAKPKPGTNGAPKRRWLTPKMAWTIFGLAFAAAAG